MKPGGSELRYFSLFAGIGGFEAGIQRALPGAECVGYSEINEHAVQIYERHFPGHRNYGDATGIVSGDLPEFGLLVAGFPCQSFSVAGKRRGFSDSRGTLFFEICRICADKRPGYLLLENVKGLVDHAKGETFERILGSLADIGYLLQWEVLNSRHFGVPQNRERVFIIGNLGDRPRPEVFPFSEGDQGAVEGVDKASTVRTLHAGGHSGGHVSGMTLILTEARNERVSFIYADRQQDRVYRDVMCSLHAGTHGNAGHYSKTLVDGAIRRLTPVEWERLQGFPDNWTEGLSDTSRYRCIGNAVTVNVIEAIMQKWSA